MNHYQAYSKSKDKARAISAFTRKYGMPPREAIDGGTCWLCGPVVKRDGRFVAKEMKPAQGRLL